MSQYFGKIAKGWNTEPLLQQVIDHPELWDRNPARLHAGSPHDHSHDIWIRLNDEKSYKARADYAGFNDPHESVWYPAYDTLTACQPLVFDLMRLVRGEQLGLVLIYKVGPHEAIRPHKDFGWHAGFYTKFNVCLQSNPKARFVFEDGDLIQKAGDVHWFRNDVLHSVVNDGETDHMIMIVCARLRQKHMGVS